MLITIDESIHAVTHLSACTSADLRFSRRQAQYRARAENPVHRTDRPRRLVGRVDPARRRAAFRPVAREVPTALFEDARAAGSRPPWDWTGPTRRRFGADRGSSRPHGRGRQVRCRPHAAYGLSNGSGAPSARAGVKVTAEPGPRDEPSQLGVDARDATWVAGCDVDDGDPAGQGLDGGLPCGVGLAACQAAGGTDLVQQPTRESCGSSLPCASAGPARRWGPAGQCRPSPAWSRAAASTGTGLPRRLGASAGPRQPRLSSRSRSPRRAGTPRPSTADVARCAGWPCRPGGT